MSTPIPSTPPRRSWLAWAVAGAIGLIAGATFWFLRPFHLFTKPAEASTPPAIQEEVPPELRAYMAQAKAGDAKAMHMIALMYWNGLNVRQDRAKGLEWYRRAATAGSTAAQETLRTIEGK